MQNYKFSFGSFWSPIDLDHKRVTCEDGDWRGEGGRGLGVFLAIGNVFPCPLGCVWETEVRGVGCVFIR